MKVFIFTEGYRDTGYGHVTRCLSLYQAFEEQGIIPKMIVNGDSGAEKLLGQINYTILNWIDNPGAVPGLIKDSDIIIVDSYKADEEFYSGLYAGTKLLAAIDDYMRLDYKAHAVINGTIGSENYDYKQNETTKYFLGAKYTPLRREFWDVEEKQINDSIRNVLITMGGQDVKELTQSILDYFIEHAPYLKYWIVVRENFKIDFKKYTSSGNVEFIFDADGAKMKELMLKCDIAVTAAGQTIYELARIGLPSIAVIVADNQINNLRGWMKNGFIFEELYYNDEKLLNKIGEGIFRLNGKDLRTGISLKGKNTIDGAGAKTLAVNLINYKIQ